jgi:hypothetical protein
VRELTRIATRKTDEELVAKREPGDAPSDAPKPDLRSRPVTFDLQPADFALVRQARLVIEAERGERGQCRTATHTTSGFASTAVATSRTATTPRFTKEGSASPVARPRSS